MKTFSIAILSTALFVAALDAHAVLVCDVNGKPAQELSISQAGASFDLVRQLPGQAKLAANSSVPGTYNKSAGVVAGPDGWPVVASYKAPDGRLGIVIWFRNGTSKRLSGVLTSVSFSKSPRAAVLLGYRSDPSRNFSLEQELVYTQAGDKVAERSIPWESESFSRSVLSEDGSIVYRRFGPGMSSDREVLLFDSANFRQVGKFSLAGEYISDVLVLDRRTAFMTAGGGLFRVANGNIESVGQPELAVNHERLDVDQRNSRVLSFGSGGYQVVSFQGATIRSSAHGHAHYGAEGFASDGSIIEGAVHKKRGLRVVDAVSGQVFTEIAIGTGVRRKIACSSKTGLVFED